ncbi:MAG: hypothetical protein LKJ12_06250, partial [Enterococcaceae bacterium]|nr:hypothetical protein [Enterococcaceae bacterium]
IHFLEIKNPKRVFLLAWDPLHFIQFESSPTLFDEEPENTRLKRETSAGCFSMNADHDLLSGRAGF